MALLGESVGSIPWKATCCLGIGSLFAFILFKSIYNLYFHPLRSYPGPWLSRVTRLHYVYHQLSGELPYRTKGWHDTYGEVVRIAPDELSYNSSQAYHDIHSWRTKELKSGFEKDETWYSQSHNTVPVIVTAKNKDHGRLRGILSHAFSDRALARQEPLITSYVDQMMQRLQEHTGQSAVDVVPFASSTTMDIILSLSFGQSLNCLADTVTGRLHPWVDMVSGHVRQGLYIQAWRRLPAFISRNILVNLFLGWLGRAWMEQFQVTTQMAQRRLAAGTDREDFVSHMLRENDEKTGLTIPELELTSSIFMTAGSDTNATALCGCLFYAIRDRTVWNRLTREIRTSFTKESDLTFSALQKLPFLNAVIEETLRLYPVVPSTFPRRTPSEGATIAGRFVPGGASVGINGYAATLCETNFTRAAEFIPERWMGDPQFAPDDKKAHQPFSTGPRNCLGKNMAWAFLRLTFARFVWNFDAELSPDCAQWDVDQKIFVMFVKPPLKVRLEAVPHAE